MDLLIFLVVISILILAHEFGHFIVAKKIGVRIEEFALGFPPKIWRRKIGDTFYTVNALPIGGYVRLYGEDEPVSLHPHLSYYHKGKFARGLVTIAGVLMNFLVGIFAFSLFFGIEGIPQKAKEVKVVAVAEGTPAQQAGLKEGDVIESVNGEKKDVEGFIEFVKEHKGEKLKLIIRREGKNIELFITPRQDYPESQGPLGVLLQTMEARKPPVWQLIPLSIWYGTKEAVLWTYRIFISVKDVFLQVTQGIVPKEVAGPVGIFQIMGLAAEAGFTQLVFFVGILSVNLAVLNIMPFPALDGGRLLFIATEALLGKSILHRVEKYIHMVGLIILLGLILLLTLYDITRFINGKI